MSGTLTGDFWTNVGKLNTEQDGTVSSVAISVGADEDTGLYLAAAGQLGIAAAGSATGAIFKSTGLFIDRDTFTENSKALEFDIEVTDTTKGARQGALFIAEDRTASYPLASWDGNPDCAIKVQINNRAVSGSNGGTRGLDINARNRDSGTESWINGAYITAENSTGAGPLATDVIAMELHPKNNGVCNGSVVGLRIFDESQSSTGTSYMLKIDCTSNSAFTREYCVYIDSQGSSAWTNAITFDGNITNVLDFVDTDGTNGATYSAGHYATLGNIDGKIKVDIGGNTLYLPCYVSIAA